MFETIFRCIFFKTVLSAFSFLDPVPNPPTAIRLSSAQAQLIAITWTHAIGERDGYRVMVKEGSTVLGTYSETSNSFTEDSLETTTEYTFEVVTTSNDKQSSVASASFTTSKPILHAVSTV